MVSSCHIISVVGAHQIEFGKLALIPLVFLGKWPNVGSIKRDFPIDIIISLCMCDPHIGVIYIQIFFDVYI